MTGNPKRSRATIRTTHGGPGPGPELVARATTPDNTAEMETVVLGRDVRTRIERETTGGLQSTVDDYVVNLDVATRVAQHAIDAKRACRQRHTDAITKTDTDTNS